MHHPEQYQAMVKGIHQDRLNEGLVSQEVSRNRPTSSKWNKFLERLVKVAQILLVSTKSAVTKLWHINLKSKQSQATS